MNGNSDLEALEAQEGPQPRLLVDIGEQPQGTGAVLQRQPHQLHAPRVHALFGVGAFDVAQRLETVQCPNRLPAASPVPAATTTCRRADADSRRRATAGGLPRGFPASRKQSTLPRSVRNEPVLDAHVGARVPSGRCTPRSITSMCGSPPARRPVGPPCTRAAGVEVLPAPPPRCSRPAVPDRRGSRLPAHIAAGRTTAAARVVIISSAAWRSSGRASCAAWTARFACHSGS